VEKRIAAAARTSELAARLTIVSAGAPSGGPGISRHVLRGGLLSLLLLAGLSTAGSAGAATLVVRNTNDAGAESLQAALVAANATSGTDTIRFAIAGAAPYVITLTSRLPAITAPVVVNGQSQLGLAGQPLIELVNGTGNSTVPGIEITAGASKVLGLDIVGFGSAIRLAGGGGSTVAGNWLGQPLSVPPSGNGSGVLIEAGSAANLVGGTSAGARNVIGFDGVGVLIRGAGASGNVVEGNYIGADSSGFGGTSNSTGVSVSRGATANRIGGTTAAARNVIASSIGDGVTLDGTGTSGNVVEGNYIGLEASGGSNGGNENDGVAIQKGVSGNTIGGTGVGALNVIAANMAAGVRLSGAGTKANVVAGNWIGTDASGANPRGNSFGVVVTAGAAGNMIGGTSAPTRNVISGNGVTGVLIQGAGTSANVVAGNSIGLDASARAPLGNGSDGVAISAGASKNIIGGTAAGARNLVSANAAGGVALDGVGTTGNLVEGNDVISNERDGVTVSGGAAANTIGGTTAGARNLISGNNAAGTSGTVGGIVLSGTGTKNNLVQGNFIGTDAEGTAARGNRGDGVAIGGGASANIVGGTTAAARNLISGNQVGVEIRDAGTHANVVEGNYIGTDASGTTHIANSGAGLAVGESASGNTIGGTTAGARNVISGNHPGFGVSFFRCGPGNVVEGNYIGVDATGAHALFNLRGIFLGEFSDDVTIGGTEPGAGNVISGSIDVGVWVGASTGFVLAGNLIGTDASGTFELGNAGDGVYVLDSSGTIGGTSPGAANTIAFNGFYAVDVDAGLASGMSILGNSIFANYGGGTLSDETRPQVDSLTTADSTTKVRLRLTGAAAYRLELFVSPDRETPGNAQGKRFLAAKSVTTDGAGSAAAAISVPALAPDQAVTATATNLDTGQTSPFSTCAATP